MVKLTFSRSVDQVNAHGVIYVQVPQAPDLCQVCVYNVHVVILILSSFLFFFLFWVDGCVCGGGGGGLGGGLLFCFLVFCCCCLFVFHVFNVCGVTPKCE